jgi:gamma-glutamylcyclotransferase (GGCT)/AIG2-like uncharacterized protein YtfP
MPRIFVYGTLMRGEVNAHLLAEARFLGAARTERRYELVDLGEYPALCERGTVSVSGELYEVDEATLTLLDDLEGHPELYRRAPIALEGGVEVQCYVFVATNRPATRRAIASGDWRKG